MINKITIIGVGLIGGSLARALKERNLAKVVFGYGRDQYALKKLKNQTLLMRSQLILKRLSMRLILLSLQHQWAHLRTFLIKLNR